jgi:hypothetical protein
MRKPGFAVVAIVAALVPGSASPSAAAPAGAVDREASVSSGFVFITAKKRLSARRKLRIPIRCTVVCNVKTTSVLKFPGPDLGPRKLPGTLDPAAPKDLVIRLNRAATKNLKSHIAASKLKLKARAVDPATGAVAFARKTLRFKRG